MCISLSDNHINTYTIGITYFLKSDTQSCQSVPYIFN